MSRFRVVVIATVLAATVVPAASASAKVLRVGSYKGISGQFKTIQAAVKAAKPHDWILIGPGDYKTSSPQRVPGQPTLAAGVLVTKAGLYLRGMNRNSVIVDGTKPGSAKCSRKPADQNLGPKGSGGPVGLNGILVWNAKNVWVQNLTACNFLGGTGESGNQIWWDAKLGTIGHGFFGSYLNATSTYFNPAHPNAAATYGIFSSRWSGGTWDQTYASNFNDSGYYIGACKQICDQVVNHAHGQFNALGYSGSNSGGNLVVKNSEFDNNQDGFDTNSQNGDEPSPQNGACPNNAVSSITHTHSCWVFMDNYVHDNNNPNVPALGSAAAGPVGTGMSLSGARNDTVMNNRFVNNKAWGAIVVTYPDNGPPCIGGTLNSPLLGQGSCLYDDWGNALLHNSFTNNGGYGNPTNGDFEQLSFESHPSNCFKGNVDTSGTLSPEAVTLEKTYPVCTTSSVPLNFNAPFLNEVLCDSAISVPPFGCQPGDHYPKATHIVMHPLPKGLKTMPNPCVDVPANPWCPTAKHAALYPRLKS